jgi:hypothetical protein
MKTKPADVDLGGKPVSTKGWRTGFQQAHLDKFANRFVAYPVSTSRKGWGLSVPPAIVLPLRSRPIDLARAVLASLGRSSDVWPPPPELDEDDKPLLAALGIQSWRLYDPVAAVAIDRQIGTGVVRLLSLKRRGGNHVPVSNRYVRVAAGASIEALAKKLAAAIARSVAAYVPHRR